MPENTKQTKTKGHLLQIEGIGDNTDDLAGVLYATDNIEIEDIDQIITASGSSDTFKVKEHFINPESGKGVVQSPYSTDITLSSYTFELRLHDDIAKTFFNVAERSSIFLEESISSTATGAGALKVNDNSTISTPAVIWIDSEAIYVDGKTGGNFDIAQRGVYGTTESDHIGSDDAVGDGTLIFDSNPSFAQRKVTLYSYDPEAEELNQRWQGTITENNVQNITSNNNGTRLRIPTSDHFSISDDFVINKERNTINIQDSDIEIIVGPNFTATNGVQISSSVNKSSDYQSNGTAFWKVDPNPDTVLQDPTLIATTGGSPGFKTNVLGAPVNQDADTSEENRTTVNTLEGGQLHECLVVDRNLDEFGLFSTNLFSSTYPLALGPSTSTISSNFLTITPYHPVAIDAAVMLSTKEDVSDPDNFDIFKGNWGLNLREIFKGNNGQGAIDDAWDIIKQTPWAKIDQMIVGWDPDPLTWIEWSNKYLLEPIGVKRILTDNGELSWGFVNRSDVLDLSEAFSTPKAAPITNPGDSPGTLKWNPNAEKRIDSVRAEYDKLPWQEPSVVVQTTRKGNIAKSINTLDEDVKLKLDLYRSTIKAITFTSDRLNAQAFADPIIRVRLQDYEERNKIAGFSNDLNFDLNSKIFLEDIPIDRAWLVDTNGERIKSITTDPQWLGQIVGRYYDPTNSTYELDLFLSNYVDNDILKWRAPSMIIARFGSGETSDILFGVPQGGSDDSSTYGIPENYLSDKENGTSEGDAGFFNVDDEVEVWTQYGKKINGVNEPYIVDQIASDGTSYGLLLTDQDGNSPNFGNFSKGDVVRLAEYDDYDSDFLTGIENAFVYLANEDDSVSGDDPQRYA